MPGKPSLKNDREAVISVKSLNHHIGIEHHDKRPTMTKGLSFDQYLP